MGPQCLATFSYERPPLVRAQLLGPACHSSYTSESLTVFHPSLHPSFPLAPHPTRFLQQPLPYASQAARVLPLGSHPQPPAKQLARPARPGGRHADRPPRILPSAARPVPSLPRAMSTHELASSVFHHHRPPTLRTRRAKPGNPSFRLILRVSPRVIGALLLSTVKGREGDGTEHGAATLLIVSNSSSLARLGCRHSQAPEAAGPTADAIASMNHRGSLCESPC